MKGAPRLVRHLWRMCVGLLIASIAFYLGPDRLPEALRNPLFRAAGLLIPVGAMSYWLWRLRSRRLRGVDGDAPFTTLLNWRPGR